MNCLTIEEIQLLIDDELDEKRGVEIRLHIQQCAECNHKYNKQVIFSKLIKSQIGTIVAPVESIPPFQNPENEYLTKKRSHIWFKVASMIIPLFILGSLYLNYKTQKKQQFKPTSEDIMNYESYNSGVDANAAYQQKMVVTTVYDYKNGNIQTSIN